MVMEDGQKSVLCLEITDMPRVQKLTDKYIAEIDKIMEAKSKEILTV